MRSLLDQIQDLPVAHAIKQPIQYQAKGIIRHESTHLVGQLSVGEGESLGVGSSSHFGRSSEGLRVCGF